MTVRKPRNRRPGRHPRYCPTCGMRSLRWAGCTDPYHDKKANR